MVRGASTSDSVELQSLTGRKIGKSDEPAQLGEHDRVSCEIAGHHYVCECSRMLCMLPDTLRELTPHLKTLQFRQIFVVFISFVCIVGYRLF